MKVVVKTISGAEHILRPRQKDVDLSDICGSIERYLGMWPGMAHSIRDKAITISVVGSDGEIIKMWMPFWGGKHG